MRVLFLATAFPKPGNPGLGVWALRQSHALMRHHVDLRVVSFNSWVPGLAAGFRGAKAFAECPMEHYWEGLRVSYPRWPLYQTGWLKEQSNRNPWSQARLSWAFAKPYLQKLVRAWRPDVIYAHHTWINGYTSWRLHRLTGIPYVVTDHDFDEITDCVKYPKRRRFFELIMTQAACCVAVASRMQRDTLSLFPEARSVIVHNGSDFVPTHMLEIPRPLELTNKTVVLTVAGLFPRKCVPQLVAAFAAAAKAFPDAVMRIIGDGDERAAVTGAIAKSGCADRITLLGWQPHARVVQEMVWADIFALTGRDEPLATVLLEAMAAGRPLVWANDGGMNDVLTNAVHGFAVNPCDPTAAAVAIGTLLADAALRKRMGSEARQRHNAGLTWDANALSMIEIFRRVSLEFHPG